MPWEPAWVCITWPSTYKPCLWMVELGNHSKLFTSWSSGTSSYFPSCVFWNTSFDFSKSYTCPSSYWSCTGEGAQLWLGSPRSACGGWVVAPWSTRGGCAKSLMIAPLGKTQCVSYFGKKPNVSHFEVLECDAYVHVRKNLRGKLDQVQEVCVCGIRGSTGYKLYNLEANIKVS